ncbi:hypothetical protein MKQ68_11785 [Chitinophaga horti]|uniref:Abi-like protein n=1 Tax=Chitinophaga horti TaxID=2920382 RepID=A0ABY6J7X0_9BACT|nr:hypothetical protein [Chitinophaga horti]UYQ95783.1 hypothetical protein MKQ68_11785 [Chitinophaga horti]
MLDNPRCHKTRDIINNAVTAFGSNYSHVKLVAKMDFGFWRYMFARHQFNAFNRTVLSVFPAKPRSTPTRNYDNTFVFGQLEKVNGIRNRIAHHEPVCFINSGMSICSTAYARQHYRLIMELFNWMGIDEGALLYGLDHIDMVLAKIDRL